MADNELKRLLQGLFSDIPTEIAPPEAPPEGPPLPVPSVREGAYARDTASDAGRRVLRRRDIEPSDAGELQKLAARFQSAARLSHAASSILTLDELLPQVVNLIREEFNYYYVGIFLVDPQHRSAGGLSGQWAVLRAGTGEAGRQMVAEGHKLEVGGRSMIGWCVANAQPRIALDVGEADGIQVRFDNPLLPETRSEMALPLVSRSRVIGAMTIQSSQTAAFTQEDITILQTMADQLANAIENARLFQERERRIAELSTINDIGQALSSAMKLDELLETVHLQVSRLFDATNFYIATYEEGSDEWTSEFHLEQGQQQPRARHSIEAGLTGYIIRSRQPILFRTIDENIAFCQAHGVQTIGEMARSWLGVPLIAADKLVGVMAIQSYVHDNLYSPSDLTLFSTIGAAVANALENLRLLEETRRRARELEVSNEVGRTITSVLDLDQVLRQIVDIAKARFGHYYVGISLVEEDQLVYQCGSTIGDSQARLEVGKVIIDRLDSGEHGPSLIAEAVRTGRPVLSHDVLGDPRYLPVAGLEATRSELDVPIEVKGRIIGALDVQSDRPFAFGQTDVALLQSLASQVGVGIDNARLFNETEEALAETETLYNASRLLTSAGDLQEIVAAVAEGIYVPAINRAILWNIERGTEGKPEAFVALANWYSGEGTPPLPLGTRFSITDFPAIRLVLSDEPLFFEDIQQDDRVDPAARAVFEQHALAARAVAILPLWPAGGRQQTGALMLVGEKPHHFTSPEIRPYRSLAGQMAIVIENRRFFEEAQQSVQRSRALYETSRALSSHLEEEPVMRAILEGLYQTLGCEFAEISIVDEQAGTIGSRHLIWRGQFGVFPEWVQMSQYPLDHPDITPDIYRTGRTEIIGQWDDRFNREIWEKFGHERFLRIFMPIKLRDRVIGVIEVAYDKSEKESIDEEEVQLLAAFMDQAALALQNAQLFEQTQQRTEQLAVLNEMGRALTATLDVHRVLENVYHYTSRLMDTTNFYVALYDAAHDEVAFVFDVAEGQRRPEARRRAGKGLTEYVIRVREPLLIIEEVHAHVDKLPGVEQIGKESQSWLGVPMMAGDQVLGVIAVQSYTTPRLYHEQHRELLTAIASQAAIAVQNARLFEHALAARALMSMRVNELDCLNDIGRKIDETPPIPELLHWVAERIPPAMQHPDLCRVAIEFEGQLYGATEATNLPWQMVQSLRFGVVGEQPAGRLCIAYTEEKDFLDEESALLGDIARRMGGYIERERLLTETRELAQALQVSEERYAMAVQAANTGLWDWDIKNNTLYWSPELKGLIGYRDDELEVDFDIFEALEHPDDKERTAVAIDAHLKDRVPYEVEQRLRAKSGEYRWFLVRGQAIWDEAGNPTRMVGASTDITERKEAEATVERRSSQLQCLSDIGQKIGESPPVAEFLEWVAERISSAMQFPDLCVTAVEFEGAVFGNAEAAKLPCQIVQSLVIGDERVGRVCIAYTEAHDFLNEESALLGDVTRRVGGYVESRRLLEEARAALAEVEATHRSYLRRSWQDHLRQREMLRRSGFLYDQLVGKDAGTTQAEQLEVLTPAPDLWRPEMESAMLEGGPAIAKDSGDDGERTGLAVPITLRGETIGVLGVEALGGSHPWTEDDIALIQAIGDQLGQTLETARLFADTQRRAERERLIGEITTKIRASTDMRDILATAAVELGQALGTSRAFVQVGIEGLTETVQALEPTRRDADPKRTDDGKE